MNGENEESVLIQKFTEDNDEESFRRLVEMYRADILRFGNRMCGHKQDAEDMAQDTMLSAYLNMGSFRGEGSFRSWLFKIASSACLKQRRKKKDEPAFHVSMDEVSADHEKPMQVAADKGQDTVMSDAQSSEAARRLVEALLSLPPKYRVVLTLRDFDGLSTEETAQELGLSLTNVKVRLHRARTMMKAQVQEIRQEILGTTGA